MGTTVSIGHNGSRSGVSKTASAFETKFGATYFDADGSNNLTINGTVHMDNSGTMFFRTDDGTVVLGSDFYANVVPSGALVNGESNAKEITASTYISSGQTLVISEDFWVWSDSTSTPALTIDISCTIVNNGNIIGKGSVGGYPSVAAGGPAIKINSGVTGVTIQNNTGAYIAGGGGGGYGSSGGGGAGGADGGTGSGGAGGSGGTLNASGANGGNGSTGGASQGGGGGGAGGGGGGYDASGAGTGIQTGGGGGGGRILPGTGGYGGYGTYGYSGGAGGSAGNAGSTVAGNDGGGGWGAYGGGSGGAGGSAIDDSGVSYTLTNNGTIYGAT